MGKCSHFDGDALAPLSKFITKNLRSQLFGGMAFIFALEDLNPPGFCLSILSCQRSQPGQGNNA